MEQGIKRLVSEWENWTRVAGMAGSSSVREADDTVEIRFSADDGDYVLRKDDDWWVIDESDELGKWYRKTAMFSSIQLASKYLIWTWGLQARTAVGAEQLGRRFQQQGFDEDAHQTPAFRADFVELSTPDGLAAVPNSKSVILSRVLALSHAELDEMLR
jgi:hypothetical protein